MSSPRKFRVWDGQVMHEPPHSGFVLTSGGDIVFEPFESNRRELDDHIPLFSTGLTDAEGAKIWEGDVVEDKYGNTGVVKWAEGGSCWEMAIYRAPSQTTAEQKLTIIGNRYENPEILQEIG